MAVSSRTHSRSNRRGLASELSPLKEFWLGVGRASEGHSGRLRVVGGFAEQGYSHSGRHSLDARKVAVVTALYSELRASPVAELRQ